MCRMSRKNWLEMIQRQIEYTILKNKIRCFVIYTNTSVDSHTCVCIHRMESLFIYEYTPSIGGKKITWHINAGACAQLLAPVFPCATIYSRRIRSAFSASVSMGSNENIFVALYKLWTWMCEAAQFRSASLMLFSNARLLSSSSTSSSGKSSMASY